MLAEKNRKVGRDGFAAKLPHHTRNLAPMIGAMVRHMLQQLPQRLSVSFA